MMKRIIAALSLVIFTSPVFADNHVLDQEASRWLESLYTIKMCAERLDDNGNSVEQVFCFTWDGQNYATMLVAHNGALAVGQAIAEGWAGLTVQQQAEMAPVLRALGLPVPDAPAQ